MGTRALILALLLPLAACGQPGAPLLARAVCVVERWLGQDDYRRRDPGSSFCDHEGLRMPEVPSPAEDEPEAPEVPSDPS